MTIEEYRKQWLRFYKGYERYSYRQIKPVIKKWGESIPYDSLNANNYEIILRQFVDYSIMEEAYRNIYENIGYKHGVRVGKSYNKDLKFFDIDIFGSAWQRAVNLFFQQYAINRVKLIHKTYQADIVKLIQTRLAEGKDMQTTIDEIQKILTNRNYYRWQVQRIARTETTASANFGALKSGEVSGFEMEKVWISAHDSRTRGYNPKDKTDHYHMHGESVGYNQSFFVESEGILGNEQMEFPGDPKASAGNVVNRRCSLGVRPKRDENGNLIRTGNRISYLN